MTTKIKMRLSRNNTQTPTKKSTITSLEIDDFWEDCFKRTCFPVNRHNKKQGNKTSITHLYSCYPQFKSMDNLHSTENRKKEAMENCRKMHERAKQSNRHKQTLIEETMNSKISNELSNCTWFPKINKINRLSSLNKLQEKKSRSRPMYKRALEWECNKQIKLTQLKAENLKDSPSLSFRPQVKITI